MISTKKRGTSTFFIGGKDMQVDSSVWEHIGEAFHLLVKK